MAGINYSDFWKIFVSDFIDVHEGKINIEDEVKDYHPIVQQGFGKLGWNHGQDLFHHYSLGRKNEKPDFFIKYGKYLKHNQGIPVEVKLPNNAMDKENKEQLMEYMRLSDSNIGIYIGEHVRVFYRPSLEDDLKIVIDAEFTEGDIEGFFFAELFFTATFDMDSLKKKLNKCYELEKLIDEKKLTGNTEAIECFPEGWLPDRYVKRAQLQQLESTRIRGEKNGTKKVNVIRPKSASSPNGIRVDSNDYTESLQQESPVLTTKKATTIMPKEVFNVLQKFCSLKDTPKHRAIYLFIIEGLRSNNFISDEEYLHYKEMSSLITTTYHKKQ